MNSRKGWLSEKDWKFVQKKVPIIAVDLMPIELGGLARENKVGLIRREVPDGGTGWCLVGGRVRRAETLREAASRHLRDTLGPKVLFSLPRDTQPLLVAQYGPTKKQGVLLDPRRHVVALTYAIEIRGTPVPMGEALDFDWFNLSALPPDQEFGFEQKVVVRKCISKLGWSRAG